MLALRESMPPRPHNHASALLLPCLSIRLAVAFLT
jgi:hypothetical protein